MVAIYIEIQMMRIICSGQKMHCSSELSLTQLPD